MRTRAWSSAKATVCSRLRFSKMSSSAPTAENCALGAAAAGADCFLEDIIHHAPAATARATTPAAIAGAALDRAACAEPGLEAEEAACGRGAPAAMPSNA